jgi:hypothetical protein
MIFDRVLWLVSTSVETCRLLMNDERKSMNAFGDVGYGPLLFSSRVLAFEAPCHRGTTGTVTP